MFRSKPSRRLFGRSSKFDPMGVAARDLRECLLIQLKGMAVRNPIAETIVSEHLSLLKNRNHPAIAKRLGVSLEKVNEAAFLISSWNPSREGPSEGRRRRRSFPMSISIRWKGSMSSI